MRNGFRPSKAYRAQSANVLPLKLTEHKAIYEQLNWTDMGPKVGVVYRQHFWKKNTFIPFSHTHKMMKEEKVSEFIQIIARLGAKEVQLTNEQQAQRTGSARARVQGQGASASASRSSSTSSLINFSMEAPNGNRKI